MKQEMQNRYFPEIKGRFAFGCLRLPTHGNDVDIPQFRQMVDVFLENGFNYFDVAHGYLDGKSELALAEVLVKRYPRKNYLIANKLTDNYFEKQEDIVPFFNKQLKLCGNLDYFDFYLMHDQESRNYGKYLKCSAYDVSLELKRQGKIKHFGISFHDKPQLLEQILNNHPQIEFVQLQFNYLDYKSKNVQSAKLYEICKKYNKPVFVMEPVKGGKLSVLPDRVKSVFDGLSNQALSYASYAIRFCLSFSNNALVLSGVSSVEQMKDNCNSFKNFRSLNQKEKKAIDIAINEFLKLKMIPCGECSYCITHNECPKAINIPKVFAAFNESKMHKDANKSHWNLENSIIAMASACIQCGKCAKECPQHLDIPLLLQSIKFE